ncbi:M23 family metallopeptidase [Nocardia higoensis]
MSNRSTLTELAAGAFASGPRSRSGHRYRDDDQPFMPAATPLPPSTNHHAAPATAGFGTHAAGNTAWDETAAWSQSGGAWNEDAWSEGSAWHEGQDGVSAASEAPEASAWEQDSNAAWHNDSAWNDGSAWTQDEAPAWHQQGSWTDGGAWGAATTESPEAQGWHQEDLSQWQGTCDSDAWARQSQYPEAENGWNAEESDHEGPATGLAAAPVAPTFVPGRGAARRGGAHRVPAPPGSLKGRAAVVAVAAGAVVAAGQAAMAAPGQPSQTIDYEAAGQIHEIAAQSVSLEDPTASSSSAAPQVLNVSAPSNLGQFDEILEKGRKYAEELAAAEAAKLRPLFTQFTYGNFTSGYGARWGVQHLGVDIAAPIGTPIYAVADGTVLEAGPASGFGMWVRVLHDDGTVTVYGHVDTAVVSAGQYVMAGDQIATVGNRGFSTGPHVHFEVWLNGSDKVDPLPWLASRGIALGQIRS